jgi:hypothetical protein
MGDKYRTRPVIHGRRREKGEEVGKVTCDMTMSVDGFVAGPTQSLENPFGEGAEPTPRG